MVITYLQSIVTAMHMKHGVLLLVAPYKCGYKFYWIAHVKLLN